METGKMKWVKAMLCALVLIIMVGCSGREYHYRIKVYTGSGGWGTSDHITHCTNEYTQEGGTLELTNHCGHKIIIQLEGNPMVIEEGSFQCYCQG